jgi:hypothetical protein
MLVFAIRVRDAGRGEESDKEDICRKVIVGLDVSPKEL